MYVMKWSLGIVAAALATPLLAQDPPPASDAPLPAGTYRLDEYHGSLMFSLNHLGFSNYVASFREFDAELELDPVNPETATLSVTIDPASLQTPPPPEGFVEGLLGENWLNVEAHPEITYVSDSITMTGDNTAEVVGDLTFLGVSKPVTLNVTFNGGYAGHPMDPNARLGFSAEGAFNRSEFGMDFGIPAPGTTLGVSDAVSVTIEAEFIGPPLETENGSDK